MLYLEDFLEVVEGIPSEVKEKTNEIRDLDISITSSSENLDEQMKVFFNNAKKMKTGERAAGFEKIRRQYYGLLESADEKVAIASNLHESLERYVRRIDVEIEKFKCELEADSPGITEILEKKSLELDEPSRENQKENRSSYSRSGISSLSGSDWRHSSYKKEDSDPNLGSGIALSPPVSSSLSYTLGHIGAGGNAIAAAASQAIAATQQMRHGRRTASLAASFDAVSHGVLPADLSIGSELAHAAKAALAASSLSQDAGRTSGWDLDSSVGSTGSGLSSSVREGTGGQTSSQTGSSQPKKQKKGSRSSAAVRDPPPSDDLPQDAVMDPLLDNPDWTYDPNEPRYCICNQVSYGNMVACDNPKCPLEWFHYACVGITAPPKGKWYCPQCASSMNRRQRK